MIGLNEALDHDDRMITLEELHAGAYAEGDKNNGLWGPLIERVMTAERQGQRRIVIETRNEVEHMTVGALIERGLYKLDPWLHQTGRPWTNQDRGYTWALLNLEGLTPEEIARMNPSYQVLEIPAEAPPPQEVILYTQFVEHGEQAQRPWSEKGYYIASKEHITSKGAVMSKVGPAPKPGEAKETNLYEAAEELSLRSILAVPSWRIQRPDGTRIHVEPKVDERGFLTFDPPVTIATGDRLIQGSVEKHIGYKRIGEAEPSLEKEEQG